MISKEYAFPTTTLVARVQEFPAGNREVGTTLTTPPGAVTMIGAQLQGNNGFAGVADTVVTKGNLYTPAKQGLIINQMSCGAGTNLVNRPFGLNNLTATDNPEQRKGKMERYEFVTQLFSNTKIGLSETLKMQAILFPVAAQQMDGLPNAASHKYTPTEVTNVTVNLSREDTGNYCSFDFRLLQFAKLFFF